MVKLYDSSMFYDEMLEGSKPKAHYQTFYEQFKRFLCNSFKISTKLHSLAF